MNLEDLKKMMDQTLNAPPAAITVPVWGRMFVRPQTVEEADYAADLKPLPDGSKRRLALSAAQVICNEQGERLFDPASDKDLDYLAKQPWPLLRRVVDAARNVYDGEDDTTKK